MLCTAIITNRTRAVVQNVNTSVLLLEVFSRDISTELQRKTATTVKTDTRERIFFMASRIKCEY